MDIFAYILLAIVVFVMIGLAIDLPTKHTLDTPPPKGDGVSKD